MTLSNLNSLTATEYFTQLYAIIKQRENAIDAQGNLDEPGIHDGGGDGNPTFGFGLNLANFSASVVEQAIRYAGDRGLRGGANRCLFHSQAI